MITEERLSLFNAPTNGCLAVREWYCPKAPSDEGAVSEADWGRENLEVFPSFTHKKQTFRFSLPQSPTATAPSSEGAFGGSISSANSNMSGFHTPVEKPVETVENPCGKQGISVKKNFYVNRIFPKKHPLPKVFNRAGAYYLAAVKSTPLRSDQ